MGGGGLLEWDEVKREAKYRAPLKTSDHTCTMFLYNVKESITHPSCTACCILVGKVMQPSASILVVWDYKWLSTLQINGWVKGGWFFGLPFTWPQPIIFFFFEITYKSTQSDITITLKMKTFESYSYSSSRHTKVSMLTAALQVKYMLTRTELLLIQNMRSKLHY
jgi:hypothetical protein